MAVEPPIICGVFYLNIARDLTGQIQSINGTEDTLEVWTLHGYVATEFKELIAAGPDDCCVRHVPQDFEEE